MPMPPRPISRRIAKSPRCLSCCSFPGEVMGSLFDRDPRRPLGITFHAFEERAAFVPRGGTKNLGGYGFLEVFACAVSVRLREFRHGDKKVSPTQLDLVIGTAS